MAEKKKMRGEASSSNSGGGSGNGGDESVVIDVGRRTSSCGYCKSGSNTSISHGLWAHSLTVDDYQALLDRGWRRSGCFLYKPEMERTCCPSYTIRLKACDFVPSNEQHRVAKRMQRFLDGTLDAKKSDELIYLSNTSGDLCIHPHNEDTKSAMTQSMVSCNEKKDSGKQYIHYLSGEIDNAVYACIESGVLASDVQIPKASVKRVAGAKRKLLAEGSEDLLYSSNISFQIAAALRKMRKDAGDMKLSRCNMGNGQSSELPPQKIAEKVSGNLNKLAETAGLSIRASYGHINFYSTARQACAVEEVNKVSVSKEVSVGSGSSKEGYSKNSRYPQAKRRKFEIHLKRSTFDPQEYDLYRKYQIRVHNDPPERVTESSYRRFLVDTPLLFEPSTGDKSVPPCGFGSFHQQYVIDGRLVAVGVIDILPKCLSSKYLFWDPDFAFLSLGKYSALQEINWVKENQVNCSSLQYYYLGYYIHSCSKMRYKAAYRPSELLCPLRYQWVPFYIAKPLLDRKPYAVLSDFTSLQSGDLTEPGALEDNMEVQHEPGYQEDYDARIHEDEEMSELDSKDTDDESEVEDSVLSSVEIVDGDVGNILIGLKGSHLRYKDLRQAFSPNERNYFESQLYRYMKVVGPELSKRMIYSLG